MRCSYESIDHLGDVDSLVIHYVKTVFLVIVYLEQKFEGAAAYFYLVAPLWLKQRLLHLLHNDRVAVLLAKRYSLSYFTSKRLYNNGHITVV